MPSRMGMIMLTFAALAACATSTEPLPPPHADHWRKQSFVDKHETMTFTVLPNMARTFQQFTHRDVASLRCTSCHGSDAEAVRYRMPNPELQALDPDHLPTASNGAWARFMIEQVVPSMQEMMDAPVTCFSCHPRMPS